jgi:subtilisin family serine protease
MPATYIVLSAKHLKGHQGFSADLASFLAPEATMPTVELISASKQDLRDFKADPHVIDYARAMPMQMVKPVACWESQTISGNFTAWGIEAVGATHTKLTGKGVSIAILDTGIDASHEAFRGIDLIRQDFTGDGNDDIIGHGTHCAGTAFGRPVNGVRIGIAPGVARGIIGKVLGKEGSTTIALYQAILWALEQGAHVISMSLSFDFPALVQQLIADGKPLDFATSEALEGYHKNVSMFEKLSQLVMARGALMQGAVIVAAAGNNSKREIRPDYELFVTPPAAAEGIISVGAVAKDGDSFKVATFSNTNPKICAPGVDIVSAKRGGGLVSNSGTSMAAPHVAGVAALLAEAMHEMYGKVDANMLYSKILGQASTSRLSAGFDPSDVGVGVVQSQ